MMKYLLVIQICSTLMQQCTDPVPMYPHHDNYYDCATSGFIRGISMIREIGVDEVNEKKIVVNFVCRPLENT